MPGAIASLMLLAMLIGMPFQTNAAGEHNPDTLQMSLEDLLDAQVTSLSKRPQSLSDTAAAVFVIGNEDMRRAGVTSIAEALRMVPGISVARIGSNKWAVGSRGFVGRFSNKLLVLVDGRSVYTPSFSGVYWEAQDIMLEDVERIEVIRGPGATIWGANAVNGVINIISKHAADTQGGVLVAGAGTEERGFGSVRYGTRLAEGVYGRAYVKGFERDQARFTDGSGAGDTWDTLRGGFRVDARLDERNQLTFQGDLYQGDVNQTLLLNSTTAPFNFVIDDNTAMSGGNLLLRWRHLVSATSDWELQAYFDWTDRDETTIHEQRRTLDLDLTHRSVLGGEHTLTWGLGYRYTGDSMTEGFGNVFTPDSRNDQLFSAFVQDEVAFLDDRLHLILGTKLEHNDYSGFEIQPSARLSWRVSGDQQLWAAVSRAVRTPARIEHDVTSVFAGTQDSSAPGVPGMPPILVVAHGDDDMGAEELTAYELGFRFAPAADWSLDLAGFYNDYDKMRVFQDGAPIFRGNYLELPVTLANGASGSTYGLELSAVWQITDTWRLDGAYSYMETDVDWPRPFEQVQNTAAPRHQISLRSGMDLGAGLSLDLWVRYTDRIEVYSTNVSSELIPVDDYWNLDLRLAWRPAPNLELSLVGQNLLQDSHLEYIQEAFTLPTEVQRGVYGRMEWRF